jgi:NAD(P)-dependent dehydrogenase (short-subunit alcohol dehydrogenase family)
MSEPQTELQGKVILVTGGGRGLGAAICKVLGHAGARMAVADVRSQIATEVADALRRGGVEAWPIAVDVSDPGDVQRAIDRLLSHAGRLDAIVNNAGIDVTCSIEELSIPDWDRVLRTNLSAAFYVSKLAVPHLKRSPGGHVVNIVSTAARRAWPNASAYHASKWGLLGLSHALHAELRAHGIKVTAIVAGGMRTPFLLDRFPDIPMENLQDPETVAQAVRFALLQPPGSVIPELMVLPMRETSWP